MGLRFCLVLLLNALMLISRLPVTSGVGVVDKIIRLEKRQAVPSKSGLTDDERKLFLKAHNERRAAAAPSSSNMQRMYYSSEIEKAAQQWANKCIWDHGQPDLSKNKYKPLGQNLYSGGSNITSIVNLWYNEKASYDLVNNTCSGTCGHYTQVVWSNSYILGCGMTYCEKMAAYLAVCNYYPGGNNGMRPYTSGAPCSQCPASAQTCNGNLCGGLSCSNVEPNCTVIDNENCFCAASDYQIDSKAASRGLDKANLLCAILIISLLR